MPLSATLPTPHGGSWRAEFLSAKDDPAQLQTFVNTLLAQGWREAAEESCTILVSLPGAEDFGLHAVPPEVLMVTAGVDVQGDRIETTFLGHGRDETFALGHAVVWGSPHEDHTWAEVDDLLKTAWPHPKGGTLRLDAAIIDSGDGGTVDRVYGFWQAPVRA